MGYSPEEFQALELTLNALQRAKKLMNKRRAKLEYKRPDCDELQGLVFDLSIMDIIINSTRQSLEGTSDAGPEGNTESR